MQLAVVYLDWLLRMPCSNVPLGGRNMDVVIAPLSASSLLCYLTLDLQHTSLLCS